MKGKLQGCIFLQPIDQHFFQNKCLNNQEVDDNNYFYESDLKLDYLNNSTESDSGESKNENEIFSFSSNFSLRKISQIAEKSTENKNSPLQNTFEKMKDENIFDFNVNNSQKNFHVPNFLLDDVIGDQIQSPNSINSWHNPKMQRNSFCAPEFNISTKSPIEPICSNLKNKNNKLFSTKNENKISKNLYEKNNALIEPTLKISELLKGDWKEKLISHKFLKMNFYKKKIINKISKNDKKKILNLNINKTNYFLNTSINQISNTLNNQNLNNSWNYNQSLNLTSNNSKNMRSLNLNQSKANTNKNNRPIQIHPHHSNKNFEFYKQCEVFSNDQVVKNQQYNIDMNNFNKINNMNRNYLNVQKLALNCVNNSPQMQLNNSHFFNENKTSGFNNEVNIPSTLNTNKNFNTELLNRSYSIQYNNYSDNMSLINFSKQMPIIDQKKYFFQKNINFFN